MPLTVIAHEALSGDERSALEEYSASAAFLHACAQGWERELEGYRDLQVFATGRARFLALNLDSAIQKHELAENATVYSGHGRRFSVVGSLAGDPNRFVGLNYKYPGYISTSSVRRVAEDWLRARTTHGTPVLLELRLPRGQPIL
jgi:ADP-ribosyltransferase exoenzyme